MLAGVAEPGMIEEVAEQCACGRKQQQGEQDVPKHDDPMQTRLIDDGLARNQACLDIAHPPDLAPRTAKHPTPRLRPPPSSTVRSLQAEPCVEAFAAFLAPRVDFRQRDSITEHAICCCRRRTL